MRFVDTDVPLYASRARGRTTTRPLLVFPVADITTGVVVAAMATRERFGISYWDAAILEAARSRGCEVVLSEDLGDGQDYAGVRVENPFRGG